jgi:uncharacterized membrane protein
MALGVLIFGLVVFLGNHLFVTRRDARAAAVARLGMVGYRAVFSIVSIVGLALIVYGYGQYRAHGLIQVWSPPAFMRHITVGLMLFSVIFLVAAFIPSHIKAKLKHPMLAILLFGSFLAWGVFARIAAKRRGDAGTVTAPGGWVNDIIVVALGVAIYLALGYAFHPMVIGVPVFGR